MRILDPAPSTKYSEIADEEVVIPHHEEIADPEENGTEENSQQQVPHPAHSRVANKV